MTLSFRTKLNYLQTNALLHWEDHVKIELKAKHDFYVGYVGSKLLSKGDVCQFCLTSVRIYLLFF